ncbi:MAG: hypothetical protein ABR511_03890 [Acidimicrobiales bacterium]
MACPTPTTCYAVGNNDSGGPPSVVTITNGIVTAVQLADANTGSLQDIACPTATQCYAIGYTTSIEGALVPITNGVVGATTVVPDTAVLVHIACPSATTCVVVGYDASFDPAVITIVNGVPGTPQLIDPAARMGDLDCPTATTCYLVGVTEQFNPRTLDLEYGPFVQPIVDGVPGTPQPVVVPSTTSYDLPDISCPDASTCFAVGSTQDAGIVVTVTNGVPGTIQQVTPPGPFDPDGGNGLRSIDCVSVSNCIAGGGNQFSPPSTGYFVTIANGVAGPAVPVAGTGNFYDIACPTATSCVAVGTNSDGTVGVVVTVVAKAQPTISTQASPGNLLGAPVSDTATLSGATNPTGNVTFRLFSDAGCTTQVFTSTNNLSGAGATSDSFTPVATGTYYWTAAYSGDGGNEAATSPCGAPNESVAIAPFSAPTPTRTITGDFLGPLTVNAGESVLITNARVVGPVTVNPGGALTVVNSQISRGIVADAPSFFSVCGSQVSGPSTTPGRGIVVSNAAVPLRIGDPANGCAGNRVAGDVILTANTAGLTLGANIVSGNVTVNNNTVGTDVVKANNIFKALACSGNSPPPTNAGQTNTAGSKSGQCSAL